MNQAVKEINEALNNNREEALTLALSNRAARLSDVVGENGSWYMKMLEEKRKIKQEVHFINFYLIRNCQQIICMYTNDMMTLFIGIHLTMHYGAIFKVDVKGKQTVDSNDLGFLKCFKAK